MWGVLPAGSGVASVLHGPPLLLDSFDQISVQTFRLKINSYFLLVKVSCLFSPLRPRHWRTGEIRLTVVWSEAYLEQLVQIPGGLENEIFLCHPELLNDLCHLQRQLALAGRHHTSSIGRVGVGTGAVDQVVVEGGGGGGGGGRCWWSHSVG